MAHYAIIDERNIDNNVAFVVIKVITGVDENITQTDTDGTEVGGSTEAWEAFYTAQLRNPNLYVKRTSYNSRGQEGSYRGVFAGIGHTYDAVNDVFVAPALEEPVEP